LQLGPPRLETRHRFLPRRRVAPIMRILRNARRDRPEPGRVSAGRVRPQDAADVPLAVEHVIRPRAVGGGFSMHVSE
jgi:hypothetical protein